VVDELDAPAPPLEPVLAVPEVLPVLPVLPEVPPDVASPGRLTVAWAARALKAARVLFVAGLVSLARFIKLFEWEEKEAHFSLITATIPF
jgi:hypothetical protein